MYAGRQETDMAVNEPAAKKTSARKFKGVRAEKKAARF
jgi:hypothetical protein